MLHHHHNHALVIISILIAIFASYTALDLANSLSHSKGSVRWVWLTGGSLAMGVGIWSMHFVGMLAFSIPGLEIAYDVPLLILSILVAIGASGITLYLVSQDKLNFFSYLAGSLGMGTAIAGMHYIGIWSMRMSATIHWDSTLVLASILIAIVASFVALYLSFQFREDLSSKGYLNRAGGGVIMGLAISGMHYTAMAAMMLTMNTEKWFDPDQLLATDGLASAVILATLIILGIALTGSNVDRALGRKTLVNELLQNALRERDEFFSIASHELKTPLTSVKLQTQMIMKYMERDLMDRDKLMHILHQTDKSLNRLTRLVDDMLDVTRLQSRKLTLQKSQFWLDETVNDVVERLQPLLVESQSTIKFLDRSPILGYWDQFRIEQVITNILTNAIRYGEGRPIEVRISKTEDTAKMCFKDQGKGIAKEDRERIFNRFERAAHSHQAKALGLGLFIVKEIVDMHGGRIWVESEVGRGSEFIVELPLHKS